MKKLLAIIAVFFTLIVMLDPQSVRAQTITAHEVLEKSLAALGGQAAIEKIQTRTATGTIEVTGLTGTYQLWAKAPDKVRTKVELAPHHMEIGFDGVTGWEKRTSVRELPDDELASLKQRANFNALLSYSRAATPAELKGKIQLVRGLAYEIQFSPKGERPVTIYFDAESFLPLREDRELQTGALKLIYNDYRRVNDVLLPFHINEQSLRQNLSIKIDEYKLNAPVDDNVFKNPLGEHKGEPYEVSLKTIPLHVYKENDGVEAAGATESFVFNLLVREKFGRVLDAKTATVQFFAGAKEVETVELSAESLQAARKASFTSLAGQDEVFDLRHYFSVPVTLHVDKLVYSLELTTRGGVPVRKQLEIPVTNYELKTKLIFPIKGEFVVGAGHDFNEEHKTEWSQQYAYDIVGLSPRYEIIRTDGEKNEDFFGWGREIIAPADGTIIYARNDVPDNTRPGLIQTNIFLKLPDPEWAIGGNVIVIDHGNGEYSFLAHMQKGSVRVKVGDKVKQGDVLGLLGNSGNSDGPHLHYHLMAGPALFRSDGLPSRFTNLETPLPKRGIYMEAK
jgi:murein DD-endopeptidase MepM/ murein hydrolase activator NlpD